MKSIARFLVVGLCTAVFAGPALYGQAESGIYFGLDAGIALQEDVDIESPTLGSGTVEVEFDAGLRFDFIGGFRFTDSVALELQAGYVFNSVDLVGGLDPSDVGIDLDLHQIPFTANLIYTFPLESRFKPFVGGGAGGSVAVAVGESSGETDTDDAFGFAYQGLAGFRFQVTDRVHLGLVYKFLGTTGYEFDDFETDDTFNHMVGLSLSCTF
jgi:opacity protein-like surface antigen